MNSTKLSQEFQALKSKLTQSIEEKLSQKEGGFFNLEDKSFTDEANNEVVEVSLEKGVIFEDMGGGFESYPISELGFNDGIYILSLLEN